MKDPYKLRMKNLKKKIKKKLKSNICFESVNQIYTWRVRTENLVGECEYQQYETP